MTISKDIFFDRRVDKEPRMAALWVEVAELIENSEEVNDH